MDAIYLSGLWIVQCWLKKEKKIDLVLKALGSGKGINRGKPSSHNCGEAAFNTRLSGTALTTARDVSL